MGRLILLLFLMANVFSFAQTREYKLQDGTKLIIPDFDNVLLLDGTKAVDIHTPKGRAYTFLIIEYKDTTNAKILELRPKEMPIVLKEVVNDHDPRIVYSASWQKYKGLAWTKKFLNDDVNVTYGIGANADFIFTGRRVEVVAEKCDNHSSFKVDILKGSEVLFTSNVDLYLSTGGTATNQCPAGVVGVVYTSPDLPRDTYGVRVTFNSRDISTVPKKDSGVLDGFKVYE